MSIIIAALAAAIIIIVFLVYTGRTAHAIIGSVALVIMLAAVKALGVPHHNLIIVLSLLALILFASQAAAISFIRKRQELEEESLATLRKLAEIRNATSTVAAVSAAKPDGHDTEHPTVETAE
jgi:hypothetical protein